ncbi:glycerophosphodiester phosphodiesterase family protein [Prosthecomicrobium sp. N25]|uniref:glycerophosphodiester phosphodiesterase family protein n=1 Tax=Prosthecomicrobium sp. N25 TaxID=3129254 RepID=UPI0030770BC3
MDLAFLTRRPIAHRGYHDIGAGRVENTLSAFRAAIDRDFAIECDLQLTADGEAVVFHDFTLDRLTTGSGRVDALPLAAVQAVAFKAAPDERIPTLRQMLDLVAGRVPLVIEIKSEFRRPADLRLVARAVEVLKGYAGPFACMSFDPEMVAALGRLAPGFVRGIVADDATDPDHYGDLGALERFALRHILHAPRTRPHFVSYAIRHLPAPGPTLLRKVFGRPLICWTVRTAEQRAKAARETDQITFEGFDADVPA